MLLLHNTHNTNANNSNIGGLYFCFVSFFLLTAVFLVLCFKKYTQIEGRGGKRAETQQRYLINRIYARNNNNNKTMCVCIWADVNNMQTQ